MDYLVVVPLQRECASVHNSAKYFTELCTFAPFAKVPLPVNQYLVSKMSFSDKVLYNFTTLQLLKV